MGVHPNVSLLIDALLGGDHVAVSTQTRAFSGQVWEIYRSPYGWWIGARIVDDEGRVHHFKADAEDAEVEYA